MNNMRELVRDLGDQLDMFRKLIFIMQNKLDRLSIEVEIAQDLSEDLSDEEYDEKLMQEDKRDEVDEVEDDAFEPNPVQE